MGEPRWEEWRSFPDPRSGGYLYAPFGAGVYHLRHIGTQRCIYVGKGDNVAFRMSSLLPDPEGCGKRDNAGLRSYVLEHLPDVEYRTAACRDGEEACALEKEVQGSADCLF